MARFVCPILICWLCVWSVAPSLADEPADAAAQSYRMPDYGAHDPPPPRPAREVEALLQGSEPEPADQESFDVLLVAGPKDHGPGEHDYPAWQKVWSRLLAEAPKTRIDTAWEFPSDEQFAAADVIVFYQRGRWDADRASAIDAFLARGGGLVYLHWAVDGRGGEEEFAERIGLAAKGGSIAYRHGPLEIDFSMAGDHPIARNFDSVRWVDESYWNLTGDPQRIRLLGVSVEDGAPRPQFWTMERSEGRVFVSIPGHYMWTFDDPLFRTLILRGIAWAGDRSVDRFNSLVTLDARVE